MKIVMVSNCDRGYWLRAQRYLESVDEHANVEVRFVGYDWLPPSSPFGWIRTLRIEAADVRALESTYNLLYGEFLKVMPDLEDDDIVIFTDCGDLVMQRSIHDLERCWIETIPHVALGYNEQPPWQDFLLKEAKRLYPKVSVAEINRRFPGADRIVTYNTGVIVGRVHFFRELAECFVDLWPLIQDTFGHQARQEFSICYIIAHQMGITPVMLHGSFHSHSCWGIPPGCTFTADGTLCFGDQVVLFRHKLQ